MASSVPNGVYLTEFELAKVIEIDKLLIKHRLVPQNQYQKVIDNVVSAKYDGFEIDWTSNESALEKKRLAKSFKSFKEIRDDNNKRSLDSFAGFSNEQYFLSPEKYPKLFPVSPTKIRDRFVKRYIDEER